MKTVQMVFTMSTDGPTLRHAAQGWDFGEDPRLFVPGKPIGLTPSANKSPDRPRSYETVLEAMADGWKLLGPPQDESWTRDDGEKISQWDWWLVKDVEESDTLAALAARGGL